MGAPDVTAPAEILVVGGTGEVGGRIVAHLRASYGGNAVIVAARHADLANSPVRAIDVDDPRSVGAALDGISTVVVCARQREANVLHAAVSRGIAYTSIAPPWLEWPRVDALHEEALRTGARVVLGTGLEPGISSVLARIGRDRLGGAEAVNSALLLGLGDAYGADSMSFILEELAQEYEVTVAGKSEVARAFDHAVCVEFPAIGSRRAYRMPFTDQRYYVKTLGAKTAVARLALDPPWVSELVAALTRVGVARFAGSGRARLRAIADRLKRRYRDRDRFALVVEVANGERVVRSTLVGRGQAAATAAGAVAVVDALHTSAMSTPGVWLAEQVIDTEAFLARIAQLGFVPVVEERQRSDGTELAGAPTFQRHHETRPA